LVCRKFSVKTGKYLVSVAAFIVYMALELPLCSHMESLLEKGEGLMMICLALGFLPPVISVLFYTLCRRFLSRFAKKSDT